MTSASDWPGLLDALERATSVGLAHLRRLAPEVAAEVDRQRRLGSVEPTVVVVGETKRGKSSLINALLGTPNLSPVDVAVATSAYLEFRHAVTPYVRAHVPGQSSPVSLKLSDLRDWGTLLGTLPEGHRPPRRIEVGYPRAELERLAVIDTPGTGGMDPRHREITLDAVSRATALLFVVDAAAPLSKPELDFLVEASKRVDDVVFVMTKTDAYPGWRVIAEADAALLRTHAERFAAAPILPVSVKLAGLAAKVPGAAGAELFGRSGIAELRETVTRRIVDRAAALHAANSLRAVRSELALLDITLDERGRAADPDPETANVLRSERDRFAARQRQDAGAWTYLLGTEIHRARTAAAAMVQGEVQELRAAYFAVIESANADRLAGLPGELDWALHVISLRISADLERRFRAIGQRVLQEVFIESELGTVLSQLTVEPRIATTAPPRPGPGGHQPLVLSTVTFGWEPAMGAGGGTAPAPGLGGESASLVPVVSVGIGLTAEAFALSRRGPSVSRQHSERWLWDVLAEAEAVTSDEISHRFADLESALTVTLNRAVERRLARLDERITRVETAMAQDKAARVRRKAELIADRDAIRARIAELDEVLTRAQQ